MYLVIGITSMITTSCLKPVIGLFTHTRIGVDNTVGFCKPNDMLPFSSRFNV